MVIAAASCGSLPAPLLHLRQYPRYLPGTVLFPALLPYIPTQDFSTKGLILGLIVAIPFALSFGTNPALPGWANAAGALTALLIIPAVDCVLLPELYRLHDIHLPDWSEKGDLPVCPGHGT